MLKLLSKSILSQTKLTAKASPPSLFSDIRRLTRFLSKEESEHSELFFEIRLEPDDPVELVLSFDDLVVCSIMLFRSMLLNLVEL